MANDIIRDFCKESGFHQWQLADLVGLSEHWFNRQLRYEMPKSVQLCLVEAAKKHLAGEEYDLSVWNEWRVNQAAVSQAKRNDANRNRSQNIYEWRKQNAIFDEIEKRRIEGGWDTWQG